MSGQIIYREKCVCGAEIEMRESYSFIGYEDMANKFKQWQASHSNCVKLFHRIQEKRLKALPAKV